MKKLFFILYLFTCNVNAFCDEAWHATNPVQEINNYQIVSRDNFYSEPDENKKDDKLFLITGDRVKAYLTYNDFKFVKYTRKNGTVVNGWLRTSFLSKIDDKSIDDFNFDKNDFIISSPNGDIKLGDSYAAFYKNWEQCEINKQPQGDGFDNFINTGSIAYKYYDNYWKGFIIRSSNINYNSNGSDFDNYRITTITVTNKKYMTSRGVSLGMKMSEIVNVYGQSYKPSKNGIVYTHKNLSLAFSIKDGMVTGIVMDEGIQ